MVRVRNILDLAGEREVREFLSFFGEIEHVDISPDVVATGRTAYATFKDVEGPRDNAAALVYFAGRKLGRRFCLLSLIYCTSGGCGNSASMRRRLFLPCRRRGPPLCAATVSTHACRRSHASLPVPLRQFPSSAVAGNQPSGLEYPFGAGL